MLVLPVSAFCVGVAGSSAFGAGVVGSSTFVIPGCTAGSTNAPPKASLYSGFTNISGFTIALL